MGKPGIPTPTQLGILSMMAAGAECTAYADLKKTHKVGRHPIRQLTIDTLLREGWIAVLRSNEAHTQFNITRQGRKILRERRG